MFIISKLCTGRSVPPAVAGLLPPFKCSGIDEFVGESGFVPVPVKLITSHVRKAVKFAFKPFLESSASLTVQSAAYVFWDSALDLQPKNTI